MIDGNIVIPSLLNCTLIDLNSCLGKHLNYRIIHRSVLFYCWRPDDRNRWTSRGSLFDNIFGQEIVYIFAFSLYIFPRNAMGMSWRTFQHKYLVPFATCLREKILKTSDKTIRKMNTTSEAMISNPSNSLINNLSIMNRCIYKKSASFVLF